MDVSHWLLVPFLTFHANVYENSRRAPREDFSPASVHFLDTFFFRFQSKNENSPKGLRAEKKTNVVTLAGLLWQKKYK